MLKLNHSVFLIYAALDESVCSIITIQKEMSSEAALTVTFEDDSYSQETLEYLGETIEVPRK